MKLPSYATVDHFGLTVPDLDSAGFVALDRATGNAESVVADGLRWIFFFTPWGPAMELVEFPPGLSV
jgi:hypothetical protein